MSGAQGRRPGAWVGLCHGCRHGVRQPGARGSVFWRCALADSEPRRPRYPPLPVLACDGFEADPRQDGLVER